MPPHRYVSSVALGLAAVALHTGSLPALAQGGGSVSFRFATEQAVYAVGPGRTVSLPVYLEERTFAPAASVLASQNGLFAVGVRIERTANSPAASLTRLAPAQPLRPPSPPFAGQTDPIFAPVVSTSSDGAWAGLQAFAPTAHPAAARAQGGPLRCLTHPFAAY